MSGFGQNAQNASAFTFPSLNQTGASTAAPGFTFGAPKTTVATAAVSSTPAFGTTASIGIKSNVGLTATPTCTSLPTLGVPQSTASGTIFGSSWPGMFSAGGGTEVAAPTTASAPSLAPVTTAAVKSSPFTFGTPGTQKDNG